MKTNLIAVALLSLCAAPSVACAADAAPDFAAAVLEHRDWNRFISEADLRELLEPVGTPYRLAANQNQPVRFHGLARLRGWTGDSLLRLDLREGFRNLRIHVWGGSHGLTLRPSGREGAIAAYALSRDPAEGATQPSGGKESEPLATDGGRGERMPQGLCHVSCRNGRLVLSRGSFLLLTTPWEGPVKAIYIESPDEMPLYDAALLHSGPPAIETSGTTPIVDDRHGNRDEDRARLMERWDALGRTVLQSKTADDFLKYLAERREFLPFAPLPPHRLMDEALLFYYGQHSKDGLERLEKYFDQWAAVSPGAVASLAEPRLYGWLTDSAALRKRRGGGSAMRIRQPLSVLSSRTAVNVLLDVQGAVQNGDYADAAKLLAGSTLSREEGLLPAPDDEQLLLPFRGVVRVLATNHPELAAAIKAHVGAADRLKLDQALADGDPAAIEAVAAEYYGTPSAATACSWLGDRALAAADFTAALAWYREGRLAASSEQQPDLDARLRLATAALGKAEGEPPRQAVTFGAVRVEPAQLERRVRQLAARPAAACAVEIGFDRPAALPHVVPAKFDLAGWGKITQDDREPMRGQNFLGDADWFANQLAVGASQDALLVARRRWLAAVDLADGKTRWQWTLGNSAFPSPLRPAYDGQKLYVRTMTEPEHYGVACIDARTGRELWRRGLAERAVSDPELAYGHLYFLALDRRSDDSDFYADGVYLMDLDAESGEVVARRHVADATVQTALPHDGQSLRVGDRLVVLFSGAALCVDLQGRLQWLRQSEAVPPESNPMAGREQFQPPLESHGRLYLHLPGSGAVECLSLDTGEALWRQAVVGTEGIAGLDDDRVLLKTAYGPAAVATADGRFLWRREMPDMLTASRAGEQFLCIRQRMTPERPDRSDLVFEWLNLASGRTEQQSVTALPQREPVKMGPLITAGGKLLCCGGRGQGGDAAGDVRILQLEPMGAASEGETP